MHSLAAELVTKINLSQFLKIIFSKIDKYLDDNEDLPISFPTKKGPEVQQIIFLKKNFVITPVK